MQDQGKGLQAMEYLYHRLHKSEVQYRGYERPLLRAFYALRAWYHSWRADVLPCTQITRLFGASYMRKTFHTNKRPGQISYRFMVLTLSIVRLIE